MRLIYLLTVLIISSCSMDTLKIPNDKGLSAVFATVFPSGKIVVAGGCNFPDKPVSEGGKKVYYDDIYLFSNDKWSVIGKLPKKNAYGASVLYGDKLICLGGMNEEGSLSDVFSIQVDENDRLQIDSLPSLPYSIDNANACINDDKLYIAGGIQANKTNNLFVLDLKNIEEGFIDLGIVPYGNRVQAPIVAKDNYVYLIGGFNNDNDKVSLFDNILRYNIIEKAWDKSIDLPKTNEGEKRCFVGGNAILHNNHILITAGVNYNIFEKALKGEYKDYLRQEVEWYKFNKDLLSYDIKNESFSTLDSKENFARAGAAIAIHNDDLYIICGELKPGIRSADISIYNLDIK